MLRTGHSQIQSRTPFEAFEERLALTAQHLAELQTSDLAAEIAAEQLDQPIFPHATAAKTAEGHGWIEVAHARSEFGLRGVGQTAVVIDSGIAYDHVSLGSGFGAGMRVVGGWDFAENDANPYDDGPAGFHGTHVAGIIGSADKKYTGLAPGVDLVALRVFNDQGGGTFSYVEKALQWVHENRNSFASPVTTVNLSLGAAWNSGSVPSWSSIEDELQMLNRDGIFIAVSAGNSFRSYNAPGLSYPAASPYVVPVASVDASGALSSFSQRSSRVIAAPGERITSTVPDYYLGSDGVKNDFSAASGTSMAAPYVAGASILVREALTNLGRTSINQQVIYDILQNTADVIYDSVTQANYRRLNLQRALDSVVGADDYGSTAEEAARLGVLSQKLVVSGTIGRLRDQDFFTFTAAQSGSVTLMSVGQSNALSRLSWHLPAGETAGGGKVTMNVVAGQSYTFGVGTAAGIGKYSLSVEYAQAPSNPGNPPVPAVVNWGAVSFSQMKDMRLASGDAWFQVTATRGGMLTVESLFRHAGGDVNLEVYTSSRQLLGRSTSTANIERVDISASAGSVYIIRARGINADVDFRLSNLVTVRGSNVEIFGTEGNDTFAWTAGAAQTYTVNGVSYVGAGNAKVAFHGAGGSDSITLVGGTAAETVTMNPGSVRLVGPNYSVSGDSVEATRVIGNPRDIAYLYDSAGNDSFVAGPTAATLRGTGFSETVQSFGSVVAIASSGGFDSAALTGSAGNDLLVTRGTSRILSGSGFSIRSDGFERVSVQGLAGIDRAEFRDLGGDDLYYGRRNLGRLTAAAVATEVYDFDQILVVSRAGQKAKADVQALDYLFTQMGG